MTIAGYAHLRSSRHLNIHTLGVSIALLVVLAIGVLYLSRSVGRRGQQIASSTDSCGQAAYCIEAAVYRYEIEHSEGHKVSSLFFLSLEQDRDPEREVINEIKGTYRVKPFSHSINSHNTIKDKETGEPGVVLRVGSIKWVNDTTVEVEGSAYSGWGDLKGYVYRLTHGANGWTVSERKFVFES